MKERLREEPEVAGKIKGEIQERVTNRLAALALDGTEMTDDDYQKIARELGIDVDTVKATALAMRPEPAKQTGDAAEFAYFNSLTPEQQTAYLKFKQETVAPTSLGATVNEYEYYKRQKKRQAERLYRLTSIRH